jgi:hypothetical protein
MTYPLKDEETYIRYVIKKYGKYTNSRVCTNFQS